VPSRNRQLALLLGLAAGAAGSPACSQRPATAQEATLVAEVTVTRVTRADIARTISVGGNVAAMPSADVKVSSLVAGRVAKVLVIEGDSVRRGELLAEIDDRPFREQLVQARAGVAQGQANLQNARSTLARNQKLYERGIAAGKDLEAAQAAERVAAAALQQAKAAVQLAELNLERTRVLAPIGGVVVKRYLSPGEQVDGTAAQPIVQVAQPAPVDLLANVPALDLPRLRAGEALPITTEAFPGQVFHGQIVTISPAVDPTTDLGVVRVRILHPRSLLRLGMFLTVDLPIEVHRNALVVPPPAIYRDEKGQTIVYRVEGETATAVPVQVGIETQKLAELTCCVEPGETIILTGGYGLGPKATVRVQP
jgi:RND family efflux transporter MFP subunit